MSVGISTAHMIASVRSAGVASTKRPAQAYTGQEGRGAAYCAQHRRERRAALQPSQRDIGRRREQAPQGDDPVGRTPGNRLARWVDDVPLHRHGALGEEANHDDDGDERELRAGPRRD